MDELKFAFYGTPELCIPILNRLKVKGLTPCVIVTSTDVPVGRKQVITPPPVKVWAQENNIPVLQPEKLRDETFEALKAYGLDLAIVVAFGKILPTRFINLPAKGTLNVHYSLLPRWRGASPVESTILAGDEVTGVCIQDMVFELDAGDVLTEAKLHLDGDETATDLRAILNEVGADLLADTIPLHLNDATNPRPQEIEGVTTCTRIKKADGEVSLLDEPLELWRKFRGYHGWPGIFFFAEDGKRIKITEAEFDIEDNAFIILSVVPEGKTEVNYEVYQKSKS